MKRLFIITFVLGAVVLHSVSAHALSVTFANFDPTTDTYVDWWIAGVYTETFTGATYVEGPWTLTLDSPVPASLPGSSDVWSIRVIVERAGLNGWVTDYVGGEPAVSLYTFINMGEITGDFATYWAGKGLGADLTDSETWFVNGSIRMKEGTPSPVPEPSTLLLLGSGLLSIVGLKRKFKE